MEQKAKTIPLPTKQEEQKKHFYKLRYESELGKQFWKVCSDGISADRISDEFAKSVGALMYIPSPYADFGGISAFVIPNESRPNKAIWKKVDDYNKDPKLGVYVLEVQTELKVCLYDKIKNVPNDKHHIKGMESYTYNQIVGILNRKKIALANGIILNYADPLVFMEYLKFSEEEIKKYQNHKVSIKTLIAKKSISSRRDKQMARMAIKADEETRKFLKTATTKQYGLYREVKGEDTAVELYHKASTLPSVAAGTINSIIKINSKRRVGFARIDEWIYIFSSAPSELEQNDDFMESTEEEWNDICKKISEQQQKQEDEHPDTNEQA